MSCIQSSGTRRNALKNDSSVHFHLLKIIIYNTFQNHSNISQDYLFFLPNYSASHICSLVLPGNLLSISLEHLLWFHFCPLLNLSHIWYLSFPECSETPSLVSSDPDASQWEEVWVQLSNLESLPLFSFLFFLPFPILVIQHHKTAKNQFSKSTALLRGKGGWGC